MEIKEIKYDEEIKKIYDEMAYQRKEIEKEKNIKDKNYILIFLFYVDIVFEKMNYLYI